MDWLKQSEEMVKMWSETQQKMMSTWLDSMQDFAQPQTTGVWEKTLETWEQAVSNLLENQAEWTRLWAGSVTATKGVPKETVEGAGQFKAMTERWVEFQQELWKGWFEIVRKLDPAKMAASQTDAPQLPFAAWQDALKKAVETQLEWIRSWTTEDEAKK